VPGQWWSKNCASFLAREGYALLLALARCERRFFNGAWVNAELPTGSESKIQSFQPFQCWRAVTLRVLIFSLQAVGSLMRTFFIVLGFTILFNILFEFQKLLFPYNILLHAGQNELRVIKFVLSLAIPVTVSCLFVFKSNLVQRLSSNWGYRMFVAAVVFYILRYLVLLLSTLVEGGGATFAVGYLLQYIAAPIQIALVVGALKMLVTLKPSPTVKFVE
jgi:hypothetical protein